MRPRPSVILVLLAAVVLMAAPVQAGEPALVKLVTETLPAAGARVIATVTDARGAPVPDIAVTVRAKTTFGWLTLAEGTTDPRGQFRIFLPALAPFAEIAAEAEGADAVQAAIRLDGSRPVVDPAVRPGRQTLDRLSPQPGFISPYPVPLQVLLLGVVLGGIWSTYVYVAVLLARMRSAS